MTSSPDATPQDADHTKITESTTITTIQRIYSDRNEDIILRDPSNRRSFINRPAYAKLHRSFSTGANRHSVDNLKGRFEDIARRNSKEHEKPVPAEEPKEEPKPEPAEDKEEFTPASFGYPKTAKLVPPLIKPKPLVRKRAPKDENSNVVTRNSESSDAEEIRIVLQPSPSEESVDKIAKELSSFEMDGKSKEKKRVGSFRKLFMGGLFGKDKKKKEEERKKLGDNGVYNDNLRNESNFNRQTPLRQSMPNHKISNERHNEKLNDPSLQELHEKRVRELEQQYAQLHVNRFNSIRQNFTEAKADNYVVMDKTKPSITDFISSPINKYIDTSSSASVESEKPNGVVARDTPPRAQETYQNIKVVTPRATIPISSERPLPNPYQNDKETPRTIERNLNKSNSKDYPDKPSFPPKEDDTYGTVFDSLEYRRDLQPMNSRPPLSPQKPLSLESTKLKLPPNREIYEPQPRVKSPIPTNKVSAEKIIATELLKNTRSPTPPKRTVSKLSDESVLAKPPMSPKSPKKSEPQFDRIVTNALVHVPQRTQTSLDNRTYTNVIPNPRASTPVDLRMSVALKMSPQKEDVRKSVEEYYWKQLKKLKEEEDSRLHSLQVNGYYEDSRLKRSRSLSPSHRGRRSLSLPRDGRNQSYVDYARAAPPQPIPEDQVVTTTDGRRFIYRQNFARSNPERRSVDSLQRPIFRRGSLTKQEVYDNNPYNKRVSFSSTQQAWPTRNGYTQTPPQRRLERIEPEMDDEVFIQNPQEGLYGSKYPEPIYNNRVLEQFRAQQFENMRQQQIYGQIMPQMGSRRLSIDSIPRQQEIYVTRAQMVRRPVSNVPVDDYRGGNVQRYPSNSQLSLQRNPEYSSRQSITDSNYGQKQITVRNKFCDIYGQIHENPNTGVVMGQLQSPPMVPPRQPADPFARGSRLTASVHDMGKRYGYESISYENRPLPPPPRNAKVVHVSDTESGSDASEIQRIMHNKTKKRGLFGK